MRVWKTVCIVACCLVLILGYRVYQDSRTVRNAEVQAYNGWVNTMEGAEHYLESEGANEHNPSSLMFLNPNRALGLAEQWMDMAWYLSVGAYPSMHGRGAELLSDLNSTAYGLSMELDDMHDKGTYVKGKYVITTPNSVSIKDRDFMLKQVKMVLKGMPQKVTTVRQAEAQIDHLKSLDIGVFSKSFGAFMRGTGQFQ